MLICLFLLVSAGTAFAADHVRIRTYLGMEPIGRFSVENIPPSGGRESWSTSYGVSPGLEVLAVLGSRVEAGAGVMWQSGRRVFREGGSEEERFSLLPVYFGTRFLITDADGFRSYGQVRFGYSFFFATDEFRRIWFEESWGGELTDVGGGLYASAALGAALSLAEKRDWGLDLSMDVGYGFQGASAENAVRRFNLYYQTMSANIALDWSF